MDHPNGRNGENSALFASARAMAHPPSVFRPHTTVRSAARALIVRGGKLLAVALQGRGAGTERFFVLPGGGQRHGETLHQTLHRECREELGAQVEIGALAYVREYIGAHHQFAARHRHFHQLEHVFFCRLIPEDWEVVSPKTGGDRCQTGVEWLPLDALGEYPLYPNFIKNYVKDGGFRFGENAYFGDLN